MADFINFSHTEKIDDERAEELLDGLKDSISMVKSYLTKLEDFAELMSTVVCGGKVEDLRTGENNSEIHLQSKEAMSQHVGYLEGKAMEHFQNMDKVLLELASHGPTKEE